MYKFITLSKLHNNKYKYMASFLNIDTNKKLNVKFGASDYSDYTLNNDDKKKNAYIARHKVNEDWTDPIKRGTLSKFILWNKKNIIDSVTDYLKYFRDKMSIS